MEIENDKNQPLFTNNPALLLVGLVIIVVGVMAFAGGHNTGSSSTNLTGSVITTLYTNTTANIRSCASPTCSVVGTYPPDTSIDITDPANGKITDISQLPDWITFSYTSSDGSSATGYISKSVLKQNQLVQAKAITPNPSTQNASISAPNPSNNVSGNLSPSIIAKIEPAIVEINCFPPGYSSGDEFDYGSGVSVNYGGKTYIETNYHVYNAANTGGGSPTCYAVYPEPPDFSFNDEYGDYQLTLYGHHYDPDTYEDIADFTLGDPYTSSTPLNYIPVINDASITGIGSGCPSASVGDSVTIFGYPASGNALETSETVTQGTVAGIIPGPIYKFDGAIDHGNSGGLAVLDKDSCDLGIPTLGISGLTAGIGYIQSVSLARQPVTESNDQICQSQYGTNSDSTGQTNSQGGPTCGCATGYTWNSNQTACVVVTETGYQVCSEDYPNETWDGTYTSDGKYNCVCDAGYSFYGGQCVSSYTYCSDTEGYGATYNAGTNSCTCEAGYIYNGSQCEEGNLYCSVRWGVGAEYDYSTNGCACEPGYESNGYSCVYSSY